MRKNTLKINIILFITLLLVVSALPFKYSKSEDISASEDYRLDVVRSGPKKQKYIALTFDDGPHPEFTPQILDLLDKYDIKATFFVLGQFAEKYPDILKRQALEGHEIGNHSYSHININKVTTSKFEEEFDKTQNIISSITGNESKVFRPPYGNYNEQTLKVITNQNSNVVLWSYKQDSKDWSNPAVETIVDTTISNLENGDIVLFHDYIYHETSNTVEALKIIIPELISKGYKFVTISNLMNLPQY